MTEPIKGKRPDTLNWLYKLPRMTGRPKFYLEIWDVGALLLSPHSRKWG